MAPAVDKSTAPAAPPPDPDAEPGYERAPDAPDAVLEESARVALDLALDDSGPVAAERRRLNSVTQ